jgi:twitching motility two-component system response regulator PilG
MQGSLKDIDLCSILQLIALGQKTGVLLVQSGKSCYISSLSREIECQQVCQWLVFCVSGRVVYATTDNNNQLERLGQHLSYYKAEEALDAMESESLASINIPEYAAIWLLLERRILSLNQGRNIIQNMTEEVLFEIFSLCQGNFIFNQDWALAPELIGLEIECLLAKIGKQVRQWQEFYPEIRFFDQCLSMANESKLRSTLPKKAYHNLSSWADGKTPLRKIARYLNCDLVTLTKAVYPCVQRGWIVMENPPTRLIQTNRTIDSRAKRVVFIDNDLASVEEANLQFKSQGYETTVISDSTQALSLVFQIQPDLIICATELPSLDGYQLCSILRHCPTFQDTSITLLADKDNFLDGVKAKLVGANNYWGKPLGEQELLLLKQQSQTKR